MPTDAQERAAEECLLPPGVDVEPISADEVIANQGGEPTQSVKVPGTEGNEESFTSELSEAGKGNSGTEAGNEQKATGVKNENNHDVNYILNIYIYIYIYIYI